MRNLRTLLPVAAALALAACATQPSPAKAASAVGLQHAVSAVDVAGVRAAGRAAHTRGEKAVARGVELSWLNRDAEALEALAEARDHAPDATVKSMALWSEMAIEMRRGRYAAAADAGRKAVAADPGSAGAELKQTLAFVEALKDQKPPETAAVISGRVAVKRDLAGLPRATASVGGKSIDMVLDTGAAFSTIMDSEAQRLGLRMLAADVTVGSTVAAAVGSKLAMADALVIGGVEFRNVVFIVMPDAGLTFAGGAYKIEAILGMPVFLGMSRIAIDPGGVGGASGEEFRFGGAVDAVMGEANMLLAGLTPMASGHVSAAGREADVLLLLDSGANASTLEARFATAHPEFLAAAEARVGRIGGAGGAIKEVQQKRLASLDVRIGAVTRTLKNFDVGDTVRTDRDGVIGQDLLKQGFAVDFRRLVIELKP